MFEGNTPTGADSFLELALPSAAIFENRRTGVDWQFERPAFIINAGYYTGEDLLGDNDGTTLGARVAWTPRKATGNVLHLGVSASREDRYATTDGLGVVHAPAITISAPLGSELTPVRIVSTGALPDVDRVVRAGFEGLWIDGPWSLQGELLRADVLRYGNVPDFTAKGGYIFGSWVLTGESRPYSGGNVGNIHPDGKWGAWELLLRFSELNLDDQPLQGGCEHDWTLGTNWYINSHWKFQANYIRAWSDKGNLELNPTIVEVRAQILF